MSAVPLSLSRALSANDSQESVDTIDAEGVNQWMSKMPLEDQISLLGLSPEIDPEVLGGLPSVSSRGSPTRGSPAALLVGSGASWRRSDQSSLSPTTPMYAGYGDLTLFPPGVHAEDPAAGFSPFVASQEPLLFMPSLQLEDDALAPMDDLHTPTPSPSSFPTFPPGLQPPQGIPSLGSILHASKQCRPCAWFWRADGCRNDAQCSHCHLCPEGEIKARKKSKLQKMQQGLATPTTPATLPAQDVSLWSLGCSSELETTAAGSSSSEHGSEGSPEVKQLVLPDAWAALSEAIPQVEATSFGTLLDNAVPSTNLNDLDPLFIPSEAEGGNLQLPSVGSALHSAGSCNPCAWYWKPVGCQKSVNCDFCHLCPEGELKKRKRQKNALMRLGAKTPTQSGAVADGSERFALTLSALV